jgi:hypothetical protein
LIFIDFSNDSFIFAAGLFTNIFMRAAQVKIAALAGGRAEWVLPFFFDLFSLVDPAEKATPCIRRFRRRNLLILETGKC